MRFYELLKTIEFDLVWGYLQAYYNFEEHLFEGYAKAFHDLRNAVPADVKKEMSLVVAKVYDGFEDNSCIFDVYGVYPGNPERYALEFTPWEEWLSFHVLPKSITLYGSVAFIAHALYELTFFGFSIETMKKNSEKERTTLTERAREVENGTAKLIPADDVFKRLGFVDERTEEAKQHDNKRMRDAMEANKRIYASLLGGEDAGTME